jgi:hypothetical protein
LVPTSELARLDELCPTSRPKFDALIAAMLARGYVCRIGQVRRSKAQQAAAIAAGTTSKNQKLSWHFLGRAVDFRRELPDGSMDQTTSGPDDFWRALYAEATKLGLRSLAYHPDGSKLLLNGKIFDGGHVEDRGDYATLALAVAAEAPELLA